MNFVCIDLKGFFLVSSNPSDSYTLASLALGSLSHEGRDLISHLGLSVQRSLTLCVMPGRGGLCICSHLLQEEVSLMAKQALIYKYSRMSLGVILLPFL